jgi:hypothetical protein
MTQRASLLLLISVCATLVIAGSAASAPPPAPPDPSCSPGPSNCGAWHTQNVTVSWGAAPPGVTASGCGSVTITSDTAGAAVTCTWSNVDGSRSTTALVRRDASPPAVRASADRGPDSNGWYNHGVSISFSGADGTSGVSSCSSASYSGPDTDRATVNGSCTDNAGNTGRADIQLKYDATAPTVEAKPDRGPDSNGWYNHALTVSFLGTDPLSGVDSCGAPVQYSGPDTAKTSVAGTCKDKAANTSAPVGYDLRYDTKPPVLGRLRTEVTSRGVTLRWTTSKDTHSITVSRRPGLRGRRLSTLYDGKARSFVDQRLRSGVKYRYTITAYDEAGNASSKGLAIQPKLATTKKVVANKPVATPGLARPLAGARLAAAPVLAWKAVANATYYNVQLYRNGQKILSIWPRATSFHLQRSWKFGGRTYKLTPGTYRWYVWPGLGARSANRYGKLLGTRSFVLVR